MNGNVTNDVRIMDCVYNFFFLYSIDSVFLYNKTTFIVLW